MYRTDGECLAHAPTFLPCSCQTLNVDHSNSFPPDPRFRIIFSTVVSHCQSSNISRQDEFIVVGVTHQAGSWPVMLWEFPGCLDFQICERWRQTVTAFQLEAPYVSARANSQLSGRPWAVSVSCVVFDQGRAARTGVSDGHGMEGGQANCQKVIRPSQLEEA